MRTHPAPTPALEPASDRTQAESPQRSLLQALTFTATMGASVKQRFGKYKLETLHKPVAGRINAFTETSGIGGPSPGKLIFVAEIMQIGSIRLSVGKSGFPESR